MKWMATRLITTNYWPDAEGHHWVKNIQDVEGDILIVSQFTLYGVITKGKRPTFHRSLEPTEAERLYNRFIHLVQEQLPTRRVLGGRFGAMMAVQSINDGPVTFSIDSREKKK